MRYLMGSGYGVNRAQDVHHCSPRGMGGDQVGGKDVIDNLVGLCRSCHDEVEARPEENALITKWAADLEARKLIMNKYLFQEL